MSYMHTHMTHQQVSLIGSIDISVDAAIQSPPLNLIG
jgi:flavin-binding protein dodecin